MDMADKYYNESNINIVHKFTKKITIQMNNINIKYYEYLFICLLFLLVLAFFTLNYVIHRFIYFLPIYIKYRQVKILYLLY